MNEHILVTLPNFSAQALPILEELGKVTVVVPTQDELNGMIGKFSIVVAGLGLTFYRKTLARAKVLKVLATATTGLDHIDVGCAQEKKIVVLSLRNEREFLDTITGTAELAFGLMIDLLRMTPHAHSAVVERGEWRREDFRGMSLYGKTLGIVGMGRLGSILARGAAGFRMRVVFHDPNVAQQEYPQYEKLSFAELLKQSDVISIHVPLTDETENLFDQAAFTAMKNSACLINTARGRIVNEKDLLKALREGEIGGYATDVLGGETGFGNDPSDDPMVLYAKQNRKLLIVPHIGGMTVDSRAATDVFIAQKVRAFLKK